MGLGMKGWYNFTRKSHVWMMIKDKSGRVFYQDAIPFTKIVRGKILVKKHKRVYLIPDFKDKIPPTIIKSSFIVEWNKDNAVALTKDDEANIKKELGISDSWINRLFNQEITSVVTPEYYLQREIDPSLLHDVLHSEMCADIMSAPESKIDKVLIIVAIVAIIVVAIVATFLLIHGQPVIAQNITNVGTDIGSQFTSLPIPTPTIAQHTPTVSQTLSPVTVHNQF